MLAIRRSPREPQPATQRLRCARDVLNAVLLLMVTPAGGVFGQCTFTVTSVGECAQVVHWRVGGRVSGDFSENRPVFAYGQLWLQLRLRTRGLDNLANGIHHQCRLIPMDVMTTAVDHDEFRVRREVGHLLLRR